MENKPHQSMNIRYDFIHVKNSFFFSLFFQNPTILVFNRQRRKFYSYTGNFRLTSMTSDSIIVRSFRPSDFPECRQIFFDGHLSYGNPITYMNSALQSDMSDIEKNYFQIPDGHWWVAESTDDHRIVGQVAGVPLSIGHRHYYDQLPENERDQIYELRRMGVSADAQRGGIGSRLLSALFQFARERGYRQVHLTTLTSMDRARAFYEKNGFIKGSIEKTSFGDIDINTEEGMRELYRNPLKTVMIETNDVISEEDQRLMRMPVMQSKHTFVQHYSRML